MQSSDDQVAPTASVTLDIVLAPVRVEISRTVSAFAAGNSYNISCGVLGSNPPPDTAMWAGSRYSSGGKEVF